MNLRSGKKRDFKISNALQSEDMTIAKYWTAEIDVYLEKMRPPPLPLQVYLFPGLTQMCEAFFFVRDADPRSFHSILLML